MENKHGSLGTKMKLQEEMNRCAKFWQGCVVDMQKHEQHRKIIELLEQLDTYYSTGIPWGDTSISVSFIIEHHKEMVPIVRLMAKYGYTQIDVAKDSGTQRVWSFKGIKLYAEFTGEQCKYVKVGTKTVDYPIMELQCE